MSALELILVVVCMAGSWFFSGIETGLISINRLRLRHLVRHKVRGALTMQTFLQKPDLFLGTTLVGNNIVNTVLSVLAASLGVRWLGEHGAWINGAVVTVLLLVVCEYFPKAWFQSFPARRCLPFAPLLLGLSRVLYPIGRPLMRVVQALLPTPPGADQQAQPVVTREELIHLAREGQQSGVLTPEEVRMIDGVFELKAMTCEEIMIPRGEVPLHPPRHLGGRSVPVRARPGRGPIPRLPQGEAAVRGRGLCVRCAGRRGPGGQDGPGLHAPRRSGVMRHTPVDHVLPRMRVTRQPVVLVTDDQYQTVGLVALENVLEEVVGTL
jgi:Mg2+/Co2+ transporter CorB